MVGRVVAEVEALPHAPEVLIDVLRADVQYERVRVGVEQPAVRPVILRVVVGAEVAVEELIHMNLAEVQDGDPDGYRLVQFDDRLVLLHPHQVLADLVLPLVGGVGDDLLHALVRRDELEVDVVLHVLHGLAIGRVVRQLEEVLLEVRLGRLPLLGVEVDVGLEPPCLKRMQRLMDSTCRPIRK